MLEKLDISQPDDLRDLSAGQYHPPSSLGGDGDLDPCSSREGTPVEGSISGRNVISEKTYYVGRPNIGDRDRLIVRINDILDRKWLTNFGPYAREFEQHIEQLIGVKHCIAVCNGTIGLEIAIRALGLDGEVIVPSFTFVATAHALKWHGITPIFCDIDPVTYTLDPTRVEELITPKTSGILGVHVWGRPCAVGSLTEIAECHNLKLMFDSAHAFGCSHNGQMLGSFGEAEVFSFHATKYINAFEGGAIVTNSDALAKTMRSMQNFGFVADGTVQRLGTNGKMSEVSAAMGLTSLESMSSFIDVNYSNYRMYSAELSGLPGIQVMEYDDSERCNYHYLVIEIDKNICGVSRDELWQYLQNHCVLARRYFYPGCHRMEPYRSLFPEVARRLPNSEAVSKRVLVLPTGTAVNGDDIRMICELIRSFVSKTTDRALCAKSGFPGSDNVNSGL